MGTNINRRGHARPVRLRCWGWERSARRSRWGCRPVGRRVTTRGRRSCVRSGLPARRRGRGGTALVPGTADASTSWGGVPGRAGAVNACSVSLNRMTGSGVLRRNETVPLGSSARTPARDRRESLFCSGSRRRCSKRRRRRASRPRTCAPSNVGNRRRAGDGRPSSGCRCAAGTCRASLLRLALEARSPGRERGEVPPGLGPLRSRRARRKRDGRTGN